MTNTPTKRDRIIELHRDGRLTLAEIATVVGLVRQTVWRVLAHSGALKTPEREPMPLPPVRTITPEEAGSTKLLAALDRYWINEERRAR